jgi:hypothetical protein
MFRWPYIQELLDISFPQMTTALKLPGKLKAYELGEEKNHATLHKVLSKYSFGKFWVTNKGEEEELAAVRRDFDDGVDSYEAGVLHSVLRSGDHEAQFRLLLSLAIDPDKPKSDTKSRPSHFTTCMGRPSCAQVLAHCRADLTAADVNGHTPRTRSAAVSIWLCTITSSSAESDDPRNCFKDLRC